MYARFTQSGPFQSFLETVSIEWREDGMCLSMFCTECSDVLCDVETDDSLGVLVRTALAHDTECAARTSESLSNQPTTT